ncbi:MAG: hypothetical protein HY583_04095 [Candidatus Omnitrophica bacterium]|nr:hypothetical protein [Candidatus Omnitrophota bacterium]
MIKDAKTFQSLVVAMATLFFIAISAYAGDSLVTKGQNRYGQPTESIKLQNGDLEVHTYDRKTGIEMYSETYVGGAAFLGHIRSESHVNPETGERTVTTYNDPFDHSKGKTERKYPDSRVIGQIREWERAERDRLEFEWILEKTKKGEFRTPTPKKPESDEWDFLPDYQPGMILKDKDSKSDANPQEMEEVTPEALPLSPEDQASASPGDTIQNLPGNNLGGLKEPEYKEIDYHKYGDILGYDPQRGVMSAIDTVTGASTEFTSTGFLFGEMYGGTVAQTKLKGKIIKEDHYSRYGDLVKSVSTAPNGVRTTIDFNRDGSQTVTKTDSNGKPIEKRATSTDPKTGITTTSVEHPDGTRTVTKTDKDGNVISETVLDQGGHVIRAKKSQDSNRKANQTSTSAADSFSQFDAVRGGISGQFTSATSTPAAGLDGSQARNLAFGAGVLAGSSDPSGASSKHDYD